MTGNTHKQYSVLASLVAILFIYSTGLTEINYYLAIIILLCTSKFGARFPDLDHEWRYVKDKTVVNWVINKIIHLTGGKHRSRHTHSLDIAMVFAIFAYYTPLYLYNNYKISLVNKEVATLILMGFCAGWLSHLFSDMLTPAGVRVFCFNNKKVALVPSQFLWVRFSTGSDWEQFNYMFIRLLNIILGVIVLIYPKVFM